MSVSTEYYLYDGNNLFSDIGGFLGLLLGASCVTLLDAAIIVAKWAQERANTRKRAKSKSKKSPRRLLQ
jgi:hypothetical protein